MSVANGKAYYVRHLFCRVPLVSGLLSLILGLVALAFSPTLQDRELSRALPILGVTFALFGAGMAALGIHNSKKVVRLATGGLALGRQIGFAWSDIKAVEFTEDFNGQPYIRVTYADQTRQARVLKLYPRIYRDPKGLVSSLVQALPPDVYTSVPRSWL